MTDPAGAPARALHFQQPTELHNIVAGRFLAHALNVARVRAASWETSERTLPDLPGLALRSRMGRDVQVLVERDGLAAVVGVSDGTAFVNVAAGDDDAVDAFVAEVYAGLPRSVPDPESPRVPVTFWSLSPMGGANSRRRLIDVPPWKAVRDNYSREVCGQLVGLVGDEFAPGVNGQLLLWHGPPGTGKTFALRALAWEWREWCDLHYVTDPEVLFGERASYMLDVLLADDDGPPTRARARPLPTVRYPGEPVDPLDDLPAESADPRGANGRWRLLVLEDTGELMSADARERSGQGLGRLLNVVDGLLGQGLRVLVLVTTNEKLTSLHPAIVRPGRCASQILFDGLPLDEARAWLAGRCVTPDESWPGATTVRIADLFALAAGAELREDGPVFGFATAVR